MKAKVKRESVFKKFRGEFKALTKPSFKELIVSTFKIILVAICSAGVISLVDYVFTQLLNFVI